MAQKQNPIDMHPVTLVEGAGEKLAAVANTVADFEKQEAYSIGIEIGRAEAFSFFTTVGETAALKTYENLKKSKGWRYVKNSHGGNYESLDEFCREKLGRSYNRMQAIMSNRNTVTQELFEQSEKLGLRQADYNAIKALPLPCQELVKEAIADGTTREDVIKVLMEVAGNAAQSSKEADEYKAESTAKTKLLEAKDAKINDLAVKRSQQPQLKPEQEVAYRALPLYQLVAQGHILAQRLNAEVASLLDAQDPLLKYEAEHALALIVQYILRVGNENYIPLDHEAIGIDTAEFEAKALGYAPESQDAAI